MNIRGGQEATVREKGVAKSKPGRYFQRPVAEQAGVWERTEGQWEDINVAEQHPRGRRLWGGQMSSAQGNRYRRTGDDNTLRREG
jgi:hypothetical protein